MKTIAKKAAKNLRCFQALKPVKRPFRTVKPAWLQRRHLLWNSRVRFLLEDVCEGATFTTIKSSSTGILLVRNPEEVAASYAWDLNRHDTILTNLSLTNFKPIVVISFFKPIVVISF